MIKVIAFDTFGTVLNMDGVPREELKAYGQHIKKPKWEPLVLPKSWETLPAHSDSKQGIDMLRQKYMVVTCSNGPLGLLAKVSKYNDIHWDAIIPLELNKVFKPNLAAYMTVCEVLDVEPQEVAMVTANKTFGDLEAAESLGMMPYYIRHESPIRNIVNLATVLGV